MQKGEAIIQTFFALASKKNCATSGEDVHSSLWKLLEHTITLKMSDLLGSQNPSPHTEFILQITQ
jgi:hypothetical protein